MSYNNFYRSDIPALNYIVQNSMIVFPKEITIATMRDFFAKSEFYNYVHDEYGFPKTVDQTDLPPDAGIHDDLTTRLFIGEAYRKDVIYYPSIIVRHGGASSVPISFNRERGSVQWGTQVYQDGYGNIKTFSVPQAFIWAGAYEGTLMIDVMTRSLKSRDELTEFVTILFEDIAHGNLQNSGLFIKAVTAGAGTESDDRTEKLFKQTVTLTFRSEWRRLIPVTSVVEVINLSIDIGRIDQAGIPVPPGAPNLQITSQMTLVELLASL